MWEQLRDPFKLMRVLWPQYELYDKQRETVRSVWEDDETVVPAGNMLGKDFIAGMIVVLFFLTRSPCRVVTTSVDGSQLSTVLWGEIKRFIQTSRVPLSSESGGPIMVNHQHLRRVMRNGEVCPLSYVIGRVAAKGEGLQGHHIAKTGDGVPRTLAVGDEASGLDDEDYRMLCTWSSRRLFIGNPWPCDNFFKHAVKGKPGTKDVGGDMKRAVGAGYARRVIRIRAVDSPNVKLGLEQERRGVAPTDEFLLPGVKSFGEYKQNLAQWDEVQICVSLEADFWEGKDVLMFPPQWLNRANFLALQRAGLKRRAKGIGVDPAEGGDSTSMSAVDEFGLIAQVSQKTPDTSVIPGAALAFAREHGAAPDDIVFDRGGGGYEHACFLRSKGHMVRSVGFGESAHDEPHRGITLFQERIERSERKYSYTNMRGLLYGELRVSMDPSTPGPGFAIPSECFEVRRQLSKFPLRFDNEGRLKLPPKRTTSKNANEQSLTELIGRSPDEADSLVLAHYAMMHRQARKVAGALR